MQINSIQFVSAGKFLSRNLEGDLLPILLSTFYFISLAGSQLTGLIMKINDLSWIRMGALQSAFKIIWVAMNDLFQSFLTFS